MKTAAVVAVGVSALEIRMRRTVGMFSKVSSCGSVVSMGRIDEVIVIAFVAVGTRDQARRPLIVELEVHAAAIARARRWREPVHGRDRARGLC